MTRDEFIDGYLKRSYTGAATIRTDDGFSLGKCRRVALPCSCRDPECQGWAMVSTDPEMVEDHMQFYAP